MSVIYLLIPIALIFVVLAVMIFSWAVKSDQFDDLEKQGLSIFFDDEKKKEKSDEEQSSSDKQ